jgi:hypothetical protein
MLRHLLKQEWEAVAGIVAAIAAIVLHFLHITETNTMLAILLVLIALLFLRDLRHESQLEKTASFTETIAVLLSDIKSSLRPLDITLVGPSELGNASEQFAKRGQGQVVWFNVCLRMYKAQDTFNIMLKPFLDNSKVTSMRFVLDPGEKARWQADVVPKVKASSGFDKVEEPLWVELEDKLSFVMAETGESKAEALVSFWGEPFMAVSTDRNVPRYILHVWENSELIERLKELERIRRLK